MQFLDGETLGKRLERGPLKLDEVLRTAMEIASALDNAHRAGITHRDLKPGNVMLTASGSKLLDFGLAKLGTPAGVAGPTAVPTMELTTPGAILGTFQYMAPEQLDGGDARARTDIFAFGAVVYEMATGRKAFEGTSRATLIGAILRDDPPPIATARQSGRPGSSSTSRASAAWNGAVASGAISTGERLRPMPSADARGISEQGWGPRAFKYSIASSADAWPRIRTIVGRRRAICSKPSGG